MATTSIRTVQRRLENIIKTGVWGTKKLTGFIFFYEENSYDSFINPDL